MPHRQALLARIGSAPSCAARERGRLSLRPEGLPNRAVRLDRVDMDPVRAQSDEEFSVAPYHLAHCLEWEAVYQGKLAIGVGPVNAIRRGSRTWLPTLGHQVWRRVIESVCDRVLEPEPDRESGI
jgi:hypothetical protein